MTTTEERFKGKIICGFAGIGKSTLAKNSVFVDLESTPFLKNWSLYANVAIHMLENGYSPMLSCHKEIRDELKSRRAEYVVVIPNQKDKERYLELYRKRGNVEAFIQMFNEKWDLFLDEIKGSEPNVIELQEGQFLSEHREIRKSVEQEKALEAERVRGEMVEKILGFGDSGAFGYLSLEPFSPERNLQMFLEEHGISPKELRGYLGEYIESLSQPNKEDGGNAGSRYPNVHKGGGGSSHDSLTNN